MKQDTTTLNKVSLWNDVTKLDVLIEYHKEMLKSLQVSREMAVSKLFLEPLGLKAGHWYYLTPAFHEETPKQKAFMVLLKKALLPADETDPERFLALIEYDLGKGDRTELWTKRMLEKYLTEKPE